jgi:polyhydroxyalkanoate synthase
VHPPADEEIDSGSLMALEADRLVRAYGARATFGLSPVSLGLAFGDWLAHVAASPGKQSDLVRKAARKWIRYSAYLASAWSPEHCAECIEPLPQDSRFRDAGWAQWPFNALYQGFLFQQQWWHNATSGVAGVSPHHADVVNFTMRQLLDVCAPSNFPWSNPEVLRAAREQGGLNFLNGASNFAEDARRTLLGQGPVGSEQFVPGKDVAVTPGKVVMRNRLIELIQYSPATGSVHPEPILIVPAWIMKYYILDLSPENSLVKYLVGQGHTVFMISWKNPGAADRTLALDDYRRLGVMDALETVCRIVPGRKVHATGYCLGGTLLAIAAAAMAREADDRLATLSLFAAQVDLEEAGELTLFIDDSQVNLLEDLMAVQGFLDTRQMAGAFQLLRSNDLIWSRRVREYLLGRRAPMTDLMAWNADATRMPYAMHSEYLRSLFLRNDLAEGRYPVDGRPVALHDLRLPIFAVGTTWDHVAPWRSVYKIGRLADAETTFLLTDGGHNAGIVSEPGHPGRGFQVATHEHGETSLDPDRWVAQVPRQAGSWWPEWQAWIARRSGAPGALPQIGTQAEGLPPLGDAPGEYVLQK